MSVAEEYLARAAAAYALFIYLPVSHAAALMRRAGRALRGKPTVQTRLTQIPWSRALPRRPVRLVEMEKRHGNVRVSELAILAQAAASVEPGCEIIEIGTFDGRTTLNLAVNAPASAPVFTLDLPAKHETKFTIEASDRVMIDKPQSGERIRACRRALAPYAGHITQLFGDSATFDWSAHHGRAGLVFVDGSHAYEYARQDSETAFALVRPGGVVLWHDYGVWPGVTQALEEIEAKRHLGLVNIKGTSLVFWRAPVAAGQR